MRVDSERRELRVADLKPCESGGLSYRNATAGDVARRLRRAITALDLRDLSRNTSSVSSRTLQEH